MGRDKATLPLPGGTTTLVEHMVGILGQRCAPVFVMAAPGQPLPTLPVPVLRDELPGLGRCRRPVAGCVRLRRPVSGSRLSVRSTCLI
ncbi:molybdenum cofactor guanylyltransferase [Mycobacterium tuberculosis]|nr:molybdenum cofactor guanylyltransferase [Mycobacterium tuberculosis]